MIDAAPCAEGHVGGAADIPDIARRERCVGDEWGLDGLMLVDVRIFPGSEVSVLVESSSEPALNRRPVEVLPDIFFARPDQLHGAAHLRRELNGLNCVVGPGLSAEAASHEAVVQSHVLGVEPHGICNGLPER